MGLVKSSLANYDVVFFVTEEIISSEFKELV
jgi:hypothetical protein